MAAGVPSTGASAAGAAAAAAAAARGNPPVKQRGAAKLFILQRKTARRFNAPYSGRPLSNSLLMRGLVLQLHLDAELQVLRDAVQALAADAAGHRLVTQHVTRLLSRTPPRRETTFFR